jgi:phage shock protein A
MPTTDVDTFRQLLSEALAEFQRSIASIRADVADIGQQVSTMREQVSALQDQVSGALELGKLRAGEQPDWHRLSAIKMPAAPPNEWPRLAGTENAATTVLTRNQSGYRFDP